MIVVVGGHSRNIGKTSVVERIIEATPEKSWTAIKITQFGHDRCSANGEPCDCATTDLDHPFAMTREINPESGTDTSRYLAAGARESIWLRTRIGDLGFAMPALREVLDHAKNTILESNSVLKFVRPDLYLVVMDTENPDFKDSSRLYLDRADALLWTNGGTPHWPGVSGRLMRNLPVYRLGDRFGLPAELVDVIREGKVIA